MGAYDLPGPGDAATWGHAARAVGSPLHEDDDDTVTINDQLEACREAREWIESAEVALKLGDKRAYVNRLRSALEIIKSLEGCAK